MARKILTNLVVDPNVQQPFLATSLAFLQQWQSDVVYSFIKNLIGDGNYTLTPYAVEGCRNTGSGANVIIGAGTIFYDGELYACTGITTTLTGSNVIVGTLTAAYDAIDPVMFSDGSLKYVHRISTVVLSQALTGTSDFDYNDFVFIQNIGPQTKRIAIGNWNMDTTATLNVAHGLPSISKIMSVSIMIISDTSAVVTELTSNIDNGDIAGGNYLIDATQFQLSRITGGYYDGVAYDSSPFNRGYITVIYMP